MMNKWRGLEVLICRERPAREWLELERNRPWHYIVVDGRDGTLINMGASIMGLVDHTYSTCNPYWESLEDSHFIKPEKHFYDGETKKVAEPDDLLTKKI